MSNLLPKIIAVACASVIAIVAIACGDAGTSGTSEEAPDFTLPVANRPTYVTLSEFQGDQNVVIVFYRGFF